MSDEEMTLGPQKFNHDSLMRFEQWPGSTPDPDGMGFVPFPNQPPLPPPPAAPPRIRHMNMIPTQNIDAGVDEERERCQAARRQPQPGEGSSSSAPPPVPYSFDSFAALMTQENLQLGQDRLLRRVSDMQQCQYHLA